MSYPFKIQMNNSLGMANGWPMRSVEPIIEQRIFITADPAIPTYYTMENAWSPVGDFTVKFKVSLSDVVTSAEQVVLGKTTDARGFIRFVAGTLAVNLTTASGAVVFTSIKLNTNELTLITISYVSATNALTATLPNGTSQTLTHVVDNVNFNVVASKASMAYLGGVIADIYLIDPVLPSNSESWKLDKPYPINTEQSSSGNNLLTYVGATEATRELYTLNDYGVYVAPEYIIEAGQTPPTFNEKSISFEKGGYLSVGIKDSAIIDTTNYLPNGAQGENPTGGWTNTGLDKLSDGRWLVGNDGRATDATTPNNASLVILSQDFTTIIAEIDVSGATLANGGSVQGVAVENDNSFWFASPSEGKLFNVDAAGIKMGEITAEASVNGLAYDSVSGSLWTAVDGSGTAKLYSISTGLVTSTMDITAAADMLHYNSSRKLLACSFGGNGDAGSVLVYDVTNKLEAYWINNITEAEAIEGVWIDYDNKTMAICHDGGFHTEVTPARSIIYTFDLDQEFKATASNFIGAHLELSFDGANPSNREAILAKDKVASSGTNGWAVYRTSDGDIRMQFRDVAGNITLADYSTPGNDTFTFDGYMDIDSNVFYAEIDGVETSPNTTLNSPIDLTSGINNTYYKIGGSTESATYNANCTLHKVVLTSNMTEFNRAKEGYGFRWDGADGGVLVIA